MVSIRPMTEQEALEYENTIAGATQMSLSDFFDDDSVKNEPEAFQTEIDMEFASRYNQLNDVGKDKLRERLEELICLGYVETVTTVEDDEFDA